MILKNSISEVLQHTVKLSFICFQIMVSWEWKKKWRHNWYINTCKEYFSVLSTPWSHGDKLSCILTSNVLSSQEQRACSKEWRTKVCQNLNEATHFPTAQWTQSLLSKLHPKDLFAKYSHYEILISLCVLNCHIQETRSENHHIDIYCINQV